jgi:hypothetical protein
MECTSSTTAAVHAAAMSACRGPAARMPDASATAVAAVRTAADASHQMQLKAASRMLQTGPRPQQSQERHCMKTAADK